MRRHTLGLVAAVLLGGAAALWLWAPPDRAEQLAGVACRVGVLLGAWWLAYPDIRRMPRWFLAILPALVLIVAVKPRWAFWAVPIVLLLAIIKPRLGRRRL